MIGASDLMRLTVDYGVVALESANGLVAPKVQLVAGSAVAVEQTLLFGPVASGAVSHIYAAGEVRAPSLSANARVLAHLGDGTVLEGPILTVAAPHPTLSLPGCGDPSTCSLEAQVGRQAVRVSIPGAMNATKAVVTSTVDGVPDPITLEIPLDIVTAEVRHGTRFLHVPEAGKIWMLEAQVDDLPVSPALQVFLQPPTITAEIVGCAPGANCELRAGTEALIVVSAPSETLVHNATVASIVGGGRTGDAVIAPLVACAGGVHCAVVSLPIPNAPGKTFRATALVGRHDASTAIGVIGAANSAP
ncbi:MAG TPA: hypothetical protein VK550_02240 [Polyangiaceae bacterium]|nr:hypothetical protein [Polyangiaceae bacterium]